MSNRKSILTFTVISLSIFLLFLTFGVQGAKAVKSILVYSGAGLRKPMDEIGKLFEEETGIAVRYNYAGSNTLLSQIQLVEEGDVYMPGATYYIGTADEKGLIGQMAMVAYHTPVIVVPEGNLKNITCLNDLTKPDVEVILGDAEAAACGKIANKVLEKNNLLEQVEQNIITRTATANEIAVYISQKQADAAMCWKADLCGLENETDTVMIPEEDNIVKIIPIGTLVFSNKKEQAKQFVEFVASEVGRSTFEKYGFIKYEG